MRSEREVLDAVHKLRGTVEYGTRIGPGYVGASASFLLSVADLLEDIYAEVKP